jgi:arylformamidase
MRIIDLSHPFYEGMPQYREQWNSSAEIIPLVDPARGQTIYKLELTCCSGTHLKAPKYADLHGRSIEHLALAELIHYASIVNIPEKRERDLISYEDLQKFYIKSGDGVVIHTGWSSFWEQGQYYIDCPIVTSDAIEYLILDRHAPFVAADTPFTAEAQRIVCENDCYLIENLTNLDQINLNRFLLIALPLNIYSSDAAPARVVAIENENLIV